MRPSRSRAAERGVTAVEAAIAFSLTASLLVVAVPAFLRDLHGSRFVEPVDGLQRLGAAAVANAHGKPPAQAFPAPAPMTPSAPPRGKPQADDPVLWAHPTWKELGFKPAGDGVAHSYAFAFDSASSGTEAQFVAHAYGDLDGDGATSTFEIRGRASTTDDARIDPGMYVEAELE
jgi:hypothetical protein